jgi:hypothetical protein
MKRARSFQERACFFARGYPPIEIICDRFMLGWLRGVMMRGLYRYETAVGRWWACAEDEDGARVNIIRERYEQMRLEPEFWLLPIEGNGHQRKKSA